MARFRNIIKSIVRCQDKYLVVERWYSDNIVDPYQWEFLDGEMEFGETPDKAAERLVSELVGIPVLADKPLYTWGFTAGEICTTGIAFLCESMTEEVVLSEELSDYRWVYKEELPSVISKKAVVEDLTKAELFSELEL